jgi:hypothetical protein
LLDTVIVGGEGDPLPAAMKKRYLILPRGTEMALKRPKQQTKFGTLKAREMLILQDLSAAAAKKFRDALRTIVTIARYTWAEVRPLKMRKLNASGGGILIPLCSPLTIERQRT